MKKRRWTRIAATGMAALMVAGALAGCGSKKESSAASADID